MAWEQRSGGRSGPNVLPYIFMHSIPTPLGSTGSYLLQLMSLLALLLFSHSVVSDSLQSHGLQYARLPSLSPSPRVCSNSCPLSWWCHPTNSSSVTSFPSCTQSFPVGSFSKNKLFASGGQSFGASASSDFFLSHYDLQQLFKRTSFIMHMLSFFFQQVRLLFLIENK